MSRFPDTRISLILRLASAEDAESWREFASIYAPAVFAMARSRGLQPADAEDFVQELLLAVARAAGRWEPDSNRARFRTWLFRVAQNLLADHFQRSRQITSMASYCDEASAAPQCIEAGAIDDDVRNELDLEYRRAMFHRAATLVRERLSDVTWQAFVSTAIESQAPASVSLRLGISIGSVYVARSRVMKMLRLEVQRLEALTLGDKSADIDESRNGRPT